ncbi:phosphoenolpyruvate--protein phosphotransferase [Sphingobium sp. BYY-5]|uniref:phosphoenolpyruvate--protein phosphotransferase n=1 Tax=Sphingobium sp. BYY-5 TaxID=2926400 RepID=UPI001FA7982C|nr:phosphoenolpyruvate--protein phosphotransferase [Sphingobium sp. BYY-5]MCI4592653.1 phosphoenolpyruvate--protein phosphotransferase [Sphingobium sp. BYY-5]
MGSIILTSPLQGWATAIDDVPDAVFSGRLLGDGVAIDPLGNVLHAPCDGEVLTLHASHHAVTLRGEGGVEVLMHLGIDTVALGGKGFEPLVAVGDQVTRGQPLVRFDLDGVAQAVPSLMTPVIVTNGDRFRITRSETGKVVGVGEGLIYLEPAEPALEVKRGDQGMRVTGKVRVPMVHGIHARPAARIGEAARAFVAESWIVKDGCEASTRSPIALLKLGVRLHDEVDVVASGMDAEAAVAALIALIEGGMDEHDDPHAGEPSAVPVPMVTEVPEGALAGTLAAPGYVLGRARWLRVKDIDVPRDGQGADKESDRLNQALDVMRLRLADVSGDETGAAIRRAHAAFLEDPALQLDAYARIRQGRDAGHAWRQACRATAETMRNMGDARFAERADDLIDLERQMLHILTGTQEEALRFAPGTILLADELLPSQVMALDANVIGIVLERGGPTSHVAILAATMGLPALVAVGDALGEVADDATLILDADGGVLHVDPAEDALADARAEVARRAVAREAAVAAAAENCVSRDGVRIEAFANLGSVEDAEIAMAHGAEGSGLLRTEFLFLERDTAPTVAEQAALYGAVAAKLDGRPLIVRLLDIGGDKPASYLPIATEENPALGLRGIRVGLAMPDVLDEQLRAILSVTPHGQCRIMVPMVASVAELQAVRARVTAIKAEMGLSHPVSVGIMVETPAAAVTAATLARHADFLSIGTNDLTQYALAMDRGNPAVAAGIDGLHPAVLQLIALTTEGARAHKRWVGVCGGLASDRLAVPLLLGLGVTELSAAPRFVPDLKALVRRLSIADCRAHAEHALQLESAAEVRALARRFEEEFLA